MKRVITACILLLILAGGCALGYRTVHNYTEALSVAVDAARTEALSGKTSEGARILADAYQDWKKREPVLCAIVRHTELDQIENIYLRAIQAADNDDTHEMLLQTKELSGMLRHLAEMEAPTMQNIF